MKIDYVEEGSSLRHLDIELPADALADEFEKGVGKLSRTIRVPGFRKGKIPKDVIRARFRGDVLKEAVSDLVPHALGEALKERNLYPLDDPRISKLESELGKPLRFRASFEVMPDIEAKVYEGLEVEAPKTEVTDEQVAAGIEALREQQARFDPIEGRGAQDGDFVMGDLTERPEGGGKAEKHEGVTIEVGSGSYHPALHEALQGKSPGDVLRFTAAFPADSPARARAGKTYEVEFHLLELKQKVLPEADDELAKDLGEFQTLEELKAHLRSRAEERARHEDEQELRRRLLAKLVEANLFDAPISLVELELDSRLEATARDLHQQGIDPNATGIDWRKVRENERESAATAVKASLLLDRISEREGLGATEEELEAEVARYAEALEKSQAALRAQMAKDGTLDRVRGRIRREKAVDFIKQRAKLK
ncbi:MAG TPA: trigger factor [Vicinamibacteria bacterium]|nr:trigger factor [Vicinamibacteria bacterium]